jgi:hypothetical protein
MQNKSNQNRKSNGKKPVKKQEPTLNDLIQEQRKLAEEQGRLIKENLLQANETLKSSNEKLKQSKNHNEIVQRHREQTLLKHLVQLTQDPDKNQSEIDRILTELEKLYGIEPKPKVNHCKVCLFQKLCDKFTADGRNGHSCPQPAYNKRYLELWKKAKEDGIGAVVFTKALQVWDDTPDQLDARFGMN